MPGGLAMRREGQRRQQASSRQVEHAGIAHAPAPHRTLRPMICIG